MIRDAELLKKKLVAMYVGKSNVLVYGDKKYLSSDRKVMPYEKGSIRMIPIRFFVETVGGEAVWDVAEIKLSAEVEKGPGEILYAPVQDLCRIFSKYCHEEINGLIIFSDEDLSSSLDWVNNMKAMRNLSESFMFDDVSGAEMAEKIRVRYPDHSHPRLIMTEEKFAKIRREINDSEGDPVYREIFRQLKNYGEQFLQEEPSEYELRDGIRLGYVCQENARRMMLLSMLYNLTGEEKYAEQAYKNMLVSAEFSDWNPYHFLDVGEMAAGMGIAYDWLYQWMSEEQRHIIHQAILEKGIDPIIEDFDEKPRKRSWNWRGELADNWRLVISGVGVGAMAIVDELDAPDRMKAERTMEQTLWDMRRALSLFAPYGGYEEGHLYWGYAMKYFVYFMKSLETAIGDDFGYVDVTGMKMTNLYMLAVNGSVSTFAYHDCSAADNNIPPEMMFLAAYFDRPGEAKARIRKIMEGHSTAYEVVSDMFLYDPRFSEAMEESVPLDTCLPVTEVAVMRSGYSRTDTWLGFHCDDPIGGEGHDHMDSGQFVLDAMGESFFFDLGRDDYNLPDYLNCYRVRDEGHNVVIFNPDQGYSMKYGGTANIIKHVSGQSGAYAIGNLSKAYRKDHGVTSYYRGVKLDCGRRVSMVQDEISLDKPADIYWFAHTRAQITIRQNGREAILEQNGKKLIAVILEGEGALFSVMDALPMKTSPNIPGQENNAGVKKLTIYIPDKQRINLCVAFINYDAACGEMLSHLKYIPLEQWDI